MGVGSSTRISSKYLLGQGELTMKKKRARPCRHVRRVKTKRGVKKKVINPKVRRKGKGVITKWGEESFEGVPDYSNVNIVDEEFNNYDPEYNRGKSLPSVRVPWEVLTIGDASKFRGRVTPGSQADLKEIQRGSADKQRKVLLGRGKLARKMKGKK